MRQFVDLSKALSDPNRVRVLLALKGRELCVSQIVELLDLATSTVSKHMSILRQAYLVDKRKDGRWAFYKRTGRDASPAARMALRWLDTTVSNDKELTRDKKRLTKILKTPLEKLCQTKS